MKFTMTIKHRHARRVSVSEVVMQAQGNSAAGPFYGMVGNLSVNGCFFLTYANVQIKEIVSAQILLPTERWLSIRGEVSHTLERVGFGVRFLNLTGEQKASLELVIDYAEGLNRDIDASAHAGAEIVAETAADSQPIERRRYPRGEVAGDLRDALASTFAIKDISMGGLFLRTTASVQIGEVLTLRVPLSNGQPIVVQVEVIHTQPGQGVGLCFLWQGENDPIRVALARAMAL